MILLKSFIEKSIRNKKFLSRLHVCYVTGLIIVNRDDKTTGFRKKGHFLILLLKPIL